MSTVRGNKTQKHTPSQLSEVVKHTNTLHVNSEGNETHKHTPCQLVRSDKIPKHTLCQAVKVIETLSNSTVGGSKTWKRHYCSDTPVQ